MSHPPRQPRRFLLALLLAWPAMSLLGAATQVTANRRTLTDNWANSIAFEIIANTFHLASFPFRVILAMLGAPFNSAALALHAATWTLILTVIAFLMRRRTRHRIERTHACSSDLGPRGPKGCSHGWSEPSEASGTRGQHASDSSRPEGPREDSHNLSKTAVAFQRQAPAARRATRRQFLTRATSAGVTLAAAGATAKAVALDPWSIKLRRYTIPIRDLPPSAAGFRIVQLSDTHAGPRVPPAHIAAAVELARSLDPDLFALTGDYVLDSPRFIPLAVELFKPLTEDPGRAIGTVAVLGNHDWYADAPRLARDLSALGVRMLDNDRLFLDPSARTLSSHPSPGALCIAGLGDLMQHVVDPAAALRDVPLDMPRIVLAHHPDTAELPEVKAKDPARRIDLMLSGHTHGGQVRLPFLGTPIVPSNFGQKYSGGVVQGPSFPVLVSRGVGMSILPVRFAVPPEVVEITLVPA